VARLLARSKSGLRKSIESAYATVNDTTASGVIALLDKR